MKALSIQVAVVLVALATQAEALAQQPTNMARVRPLLNAGSLPVAQPYPYYRPNPHYYRRGGGTVAGSYLRGAAALTYSRGQYNRLTAEGRLIHAYADGQDISNHEQGARTYLAMRQAYRQAVAAERGPQATPADLKRFAAQGTPARLGPSELSNTGQISWPILLQAGEFAAFRAELEVAFARRAADGHVRLKDHVMVSRTAKVMLEALKTYVGVVDPMDYMAARRFIESLVFEARKPLGHDNGRWVAGALAAAAR